MLVTSPMRKKETKKNRRKAAPRRKKSAPKSSSQNGKKNHGRRIKKSKSKLSLPSVKPWKIILGAVIIGALGVLYLGHVFATQKLLSNVQQLQQKYNQAKRSRDSYRLIYDRMIGPAEIYNKAKAKGFINGGPAEKVIEVGNK